MYWRIMIQCDHWDNRKKVERYLKTLGLNPELKDCFYIWVTGLSWSDAQAVRDMLKKDFGEPSKEAGAMIQFINLTSAAGGW